jgi:hypothetical protein
MQELRELARRTGDAIEVTLFWDPSADSVFVDVNDERQGRRLRIAVSNGNALDAFHHPYAYHRWNQHEQPAVAA